MNALLLFMSYGYDQNPTAIDTLLLFIVYCYEYPAALKTRL